MFVTKDGEIVYALPNNSSELGSSEFTIRCLKPGGSEDRRQDGGGLHSPNGIHEGRYVA